MGYNTDIKQPQPPTHTHTHRHTYTHRQHKHTQRHRQRHRQRHTHTHMNRKENYPAPGSNYMIDWFVNICIAVCTAIARVIIKLHLVIDEKVNRRAQGVWVEISKYPKKRGRNKGFLLFSTKNKEEIRNFGQNIYPRGLSSWTLYRSILF